jgi:hypothetical protein
MYRFLKINFDRNEDDIHNKILPVLADILKRQKIPLNEQWWNF